MDKQPRAAGALAHKALSPRNFWIYSEWPVDFDTVTIAQGLLQAHFAPPYANDGMFRINGSEALQQAAGLKR